MRGEAWLSKARCEAKRSYGLRAPPRTRFATARCEQDGEASAGARDCAVFFPGA